MTLIQDCFAAQGLGLAAGLYCSFMVLKPTSKLDFLIRGSVSLITGFIFTQTASEKLTLDITAAAFLATCSAWPLMGLLYRLCTDPKHFIELLKVWKNE